VTVIRLSVNLSEERAAALREIAKTPGITVTEAVRRALATEALPGGPIELGPLSDGDEWPRRAEDIVQDFLDLAWAGEEEPPPLASSLIGELTLHGFRVVEVLDG
jgi:ribbon-helix-helix CopG family protein